MNSRASVANVSVVKFLTADLDISRLTPRSYQVSLREALNVSQSPDIEPMSLQSYTPCQKYFRVKNSSKNMFYNKPVGFRLVTKLSSTLFLGRVNPSMSCYKCAAICLSHNACDIYV